MNMADDVEAFIAATELGPDERFVHDAHADAPHRHDGDNLIYAHPRLAQYGIENMKGDPIENLHRHLTGNHAAIIGAKDITIRAFREPALRFHLGSEHALANWIDAPDPEAIHDRDHASPGSAPRPFLVREHPVGSLFGDPEKARQSAAAPITEDTVE